MECRGHVGSLTSDKLEHLLQHCADLGINVEWAELPDKRHGEYRLEGDRIILSLRLTRRQTIACLAHELGHQEFGDRCSTRRAEERAWEYAAAFLITPTEYQAAERLAGHHLSALAAELEVTPKVITAWRRWWSKRGRFLSGDEGRAVDFEY